MGRRRRRGRKRAHNWILTKSGDLLWHYNFNQRSGGQVKHKEQAQAGSEVTAWPYRSLPSYCPSQQSQNNAAPPPKYHFHFGDQPNIVSLVLGRPSPVFLLFVLEERPKHLLDFDWNYVIMGGAGSSSAK